MDNTSKKRAVFLLQDDIDRHGEGCDCGLCDGLGKSYGVSLRDVFNPDEAQARFYGCSGVVAEAKALAKCERNGWELVSYDMDTRLVSGMVLKIPLEDVFEMSRREFLNTIAIKMLQLEGRVSVVESEKEGLFPNVGYEMASVDGNTFDINVEVRINDKLIGFLKAQP